ncbi:hypothetical protein GCM10011507_34300 [Edaphobacter acidisoli]|uniref:Type IV secretion system protein VirB10 n=1 Tax=Edaphobacter acidisoli TaxID=2040573 RepID=A0A916S1G3_9BACT|nr:TrbI/VirB10 family protein [Edaphobacter acidisoli]GGA80192.1 hypothetical protein GCM10011507_34300 [Edaphobacter acidisoli]
MADEKQITPLESPQLPEEAPVLRDKRTRPEGAVPRQAQSYIVAGLAAMVLLAVMFSKNHARSAVQEASPAPLAVSTDTNQRKIEELEQDLSADQRRSQQQQQTQSTASAVPNPNAASSSAPAVQSGTALPVAPSAAATEPPRDPVRDAEEALAFKSRFASNLVSSSARVSQETNAAVHDNPIRPLDSEPVERTDAVTVLKHPAEVNINSAHGQPYVIFEGTTVDTVLVNRLDGEFTGPVKVMVTDPVYSQDRQHLLVPEGTFILGEVQKVTGLGQKRLALTFHRLIMPDGYSVDLNQFHGLDQSGATGLKGKVNNHYAEIFGASIALGLVAGAAEATNANQGYNQSGSEAYRAGIASSLSQSSAEVLDRFVNIPPTITIREGHRIKVYITQDLLLPAYENHTVPGNI